MVETVVRAIIADEDDPTMKRIWRVLSGKINAPGFYYLHERAIGGNNEQWQEVLALVEKRGYLNEELLSYLKERLHG